MNPYEDEWKKINPNGPLICHVLYMAYHCIWHTIGKLLSSTFPIRVQPLLYPSALCPYRRICGNLNDSKIVRKDLFIFLSTKYCTTCGFIISPYFPVGGHLSKERHRQKFVPLVSQIWKKLTRKCLTTYDSVHLGKFFKLTLVKYALFRGETLVPGRNGSCCKAYLVPKRDPF